MLEKQVDTAWLFSEQAVPAGSTPFHQANGYVFCDPVQMLTCWVALEDSDGLSVIPKLHRRGPMEHKWSSESNSLTIPGLRKDDAIALPLRAGDVAVFWSVTPTSVGGGAGKAYSMQYAVDDWDALLWQPGADERAP